MPAFPAFHHGVDKRLDMTGSLPYLFMHDFCRLYLKKVVVQAEKEFSPHVFPSGFNQRAEMGIIIDSGKSPVNLRALPKEPAPAGDFLDFVFLHIYYFAPHYKNP